MPDLGVHTLRNDLWKQFGEVWRWRIENTQNATQVVVVGAWKPQIPNQLQTTVDHVHRVSDEDKYSSEN